MSGRIIAGLLVILVGVGLLLDARGIMDFGDVFGTYWPLILVAVGVGMIASRPHHLTGGVIVMVLGAAFLARNVGWFPDDLFRSAWPLAIILIGLLLLLPRVPRRRVQTGVPGPPGSGPDTIRLSAYFAGAEEVVRSREFKGGKIDVAFGGAKVDLRGSELAAAGAQLEASAIFGGIEILVPTTWRVVVNARPILGGVENKTLPLAPTQTSGPVLEINASAAFGGVTIKN